jgi:hypothetical protein
LQDAAQSLLKTLSGMTDAELWCELASQATRGELQ